MDKDIQELLRIIDSGNYKVKTMVEYMRRLLVLLAKEKLNNINQEQK